MDLHSVIPILKNVPQENNIYRSLSLPRPPLVPIQLYVCTIGDQAASWFEGVTACDDLDILLEVTNRSLQSKLPAYWNGGVCLQSSHFFTQ